MLLTEQELLKFEKENPEGVALPKILEFLEKKGVSFSEATFRKYVQLGLLERSRRIGRKGKHQGSMGIYPSTTLRKINEIRRMISANYTIEDIQRSFLRFKNEIDTLSRVAGQLLQSFMQEIEFCKEPSRQKSLSKEISFLEKEVESLIERISILERQIVSPREREIYARTIFTGSIGAEELL